MCEGECGARTYRDVRACVGRKYRNGTVSEHIAIHTSESDAQSAASPGAAALLRSGGALHLLGNDAARAAAFSAISARRACTVSIVSQDSRDSC